MKAKIIQMTSPVFECLYVDKEDLVNSGVTDVFDGVYIAVNGNEVLIWYDDIRNFVLSDVSVGKVVELPDELMEIVFTFIRAQKELNEHVEEFRAFLPE